MRGRILKSDEEKSLLKFVELKQTETVEHTSYMLRSIPFHPNMNLNLSFSIFTHDLAMDASFYK